MASDADKLRKASNWGPVNGVDGREEPPIPRSPSTYPEAADLCDMGDSLDAVNGPLSNGLCRRDIVIVNEMGLHARPASMLVEVSNRFNCEVTIHKGSEQVDGKSILQLLSLSAEAGTPLVLETRGPEAQAALDALCSLIAAGFHESIASDDTTPDD